MTCPRCGGDSVRKTNTVLDDGMVGKIVYVKTVCNSCGFGVANAAWTENDEVQYCGWNVGEGVPPTAPKAVKEAER